MQLQIIALTAILATAIALPLPDLMGHFSFKRQLPIPADITGAVAGSISGITGALTGGVAGAIGAATGAGASVISVTPLGSLPLGSLPVGSLPVGGLPI